MAFDDLQSFLLHLEASGDLKRVRVEVDPEYEIAEIAQRVVRSGGPALLFERVKGSRFPLAINFFGTMKRIEQSIGVEPEALGQRLVSFAQELNPPSISRIFGQKDLLPRFLGYRPRQVGSGRCHEVIDSDPDLTALPVIKCWPQDAGRFFTFPLVMTRHPETGKSNLGIYRMQLFDGRSTGMHWQIHKGGGFHYHESEKLGKALPAAVVLGADPALMLTAMFPLPEAFEEIAFSGILRGAPSRVTRAHSLDIDVPANAEFVLEGEVPVGERRLEGPFGDHFGHYCDPADFPVFHVRTITHRRNPVYPAAVVGKPPQEDRYMGDAAQQIMGPLIRLIRPEVRDVWAYYEAGFHNLLVVSMESRYTREPIRTALGILGEGQLGLSKVLVLVEPDVDARSFPAVLRAIRDNFNPRDHFHLISRAPLDTLDFTSFKLHHGSRMIIDATAHRAEYSGGAKAGAASESDAHTVKSTALTKDPSECAPHVKASRLWEDSMLVVQAQRAEEGIGRRILAALVAHEDMQELKVIAVVGPDVDINDDVDAIWGIFTRFDPARDLMFTDAAMDGVQPRYEGVMGIDATWKPGYPDTVAMEPDVVKRVDERWNQYGL